MRRTAIAVWLLVMIAASFAYGAPRHRHARHSAATRSLGKLNIYVYAAAEKGDVSWLRSLFERGARADGDFLDMGMGSPLMEAAESGHPAAVRFLLSHGAGVNGQDNIGNTALDRAENRERLVSPATRGKYRQVIAILKGAGGESLLQNHAHSVPRGSNRQHDTWMPRHW